MTLNVDEVVGVVADIRDEFGDDAAAAMVEAFGGSKLYVPQHLGRDHRLVEALGLQVARWLHREFRGAYLEVPSCKSADRAARDETMRSEAAAGASLAELARRYRLSRRHVRRIVSDAAAL